MLQLKDNSNRPGLLLPVPFFVLWFCFVFATDFNSVKLKAGTCINALTFSINMNLSIFSICIVCFIYFVIVIYTVFAKINMHIHN